MDCSEFSLVTRDCPLCGSESHSLTHEVTETLAYKHLPDDLTFRVVTCDECGLLFVNPRLDQDTLASLYAGDLYDSWGTDREYEPQVTLRHDIYHHNLPERQVAYDRFCDHLEQWGISGSVFELGTGFGYLLNTMRERGFDVHGVELSTETSRFAIDTFGFENVRCGDFLTLDFGEPKHDLIVLWHVFEHLYHPNQTLAKCARMLKPGGVIMLTTPFHQVYTEDKINPVEHLYYFQQADVQRFLKKHIGQDTWVDDPYVFARKA